MLGKIEAVAKKIYGAEHVRASTAVQKKLEEWTRDYPRFPVCLAKTQSSFSTDPTVRGAPTGHTLEVREVRINHGAGFVVAVCGDMMTMPGLPKVPAAEKINLDDDG